MNIAQAVHDVPATPPAQPGMRTPHCHSLSSVEDDSDQEGVVHHAEPDHSVDEGIAVEVILMSSRPFVKRGPSISFVNRSPLCTSLAALHS